MLFQLSSWLHTLFLFFSSGNMCIFARPKNYNQAPGLSGFIP